MSLAFLPQGSLVPLELFRSAEWPEGIRFGGGNGLCVLDHDRDGWPDVYLHYSGNLWRNVQGKSWSFAGNLLELMPPTVLRYGASSADYDNDGFPDIATEQYGDCFYLLRNRGRVAAGEPLFEEVASDPAVVDGQPCGMYAETACWADVDGDGDLDLFVPAYPDSVYAGSGGNRFWRNLGPDGGGRYRLALDTPAAGLLIPPDVQRPEGAQFCDVDRDGDLDLFCNHTLYRNVSDTRPSFLALGGAETGMRFQEQLDEGALFLDFDLDGDQDLLVVYAGFRVRLWENQGDATFRPGTSWIEDPRLGAYQGISAEDWDLDGDLDFTLGDVFRRNLLVEEGQPFFAIVPHDLRIHRAQSPAWLDWDRDGDLDAVMTSSTSRQLLFENTTNGGAARGSARPSVRVRVVRDSPEWAGGLETEFGATVELRPHGDPPGRVRRRFVASSHGYLQQSEYALTLALPSGPDPSDPAAGVRFDLAVDFPGREDAGPRRIDGHVNPLLSGIALEKLAPREITVFRSGKVRLGERLVEPRPGALAELRTHGALALPAPGAPLPEPVATGVDRWVGLELVTPPRSRLRLEELVLDGELASGEPAAHNLALWDVTVPGQPRLLWSGRGEPQPRNHRQFARLALELPAARRLRFVAQVAAERRTPFTPSGADEPLLFTGGLAFSDPSPSSGAAVAAAERNAEASLWLRYRVDGSRAR